MIDSSALPPPPPPPPPFTHVVAGPAPKLGHRRLLLIAGTVITVLVVLLTLIATRAAGRSPHCGFYCGPHTGPRLADQKSFTNRKWGFVVDYGGADLSLNQSDPDGDSVDLLAGDGGGNAAGEILITAMSRTSTQSAIASALSAFSGNSFSDIRRVEAVPGAEIGLIPGDGEGYTATLASTAGSTGSSVGIEIIAVTHGDETLVASMWSATSTDASAPFYMAAEQDFDHVLTDLHLSSG